MWLTAVVTGVPAGGGLVPAFLWQLKQFVLGVVPATCWYVSIVLFVR